MGTSQGIHIFSNGFEFDCWEAKNCDRCVKEPTCDLLAARLKAVICEMEAAS